MHPDSQPQTSRPGANIVERTVSEISAAVKNTIEDNFGLVRVRGEIGRVSRPGSGHVYLDLKDDRAVLSGVIWKGTASRLQTMPEQGLEVIATGKITTFAGQSKYQIVIDALEPAGEGALMALLEARRKKLEAEGLFAAERKQKLPFMPTVIGVVTSPTGAVIRDVLHRISDRFPLHVIVWPVRVQGENCGNEIAAAIRGFNLLDAGSPVVRPDVLIVARGGGSLEDMWGFNDEEVVRAAAQSQIPLISAIGHETDWSLLDLAADWRAPTPTGAAEIAVPVKADLLARIAAFAARLNSGISRRIDRSRTDLRAAMRGLGAPQEILSGPSQKLDLAASRLGSALVLARQRKLADFRSIAGRVSPMLLRRRIVNERGRVGQMDRRHRNAYLISLKQADARLAGLSPRLQPDRINKIVGRCAERLAGTWRLVESLSHARVLERGFAIVADSAGKAVTSAAKMTGGKAYSVQFHDGEVGVLAQTTGARRTQQKPATSAAPKAKQGDLF